MGFLPSRMSRLLVGGHKARLEAVIEALHAQGVVHIEDYRDPTGTTGIGTPLEAGDQASALLVRVRGLQKALGTDPFAPLPAGTTAPAADGALQLLEEADRATAPALDHLRSLREAWARAEAEAAVMAPLSGLDVDLTGVTGLRSVRVLVGTCRTDPTPALARTGVTHEAQVAPSTAGHAVAVVVAATAAAPIERALSESGFAPSALPPTAAGTPSQRLAALAAEKKALEGQLQAADAAVAASRAAWAPRLAALEQALAIQVEKTQAPLRFGVTQTTFHIEGWVPAGRAPEVAQALAARFGDNVYFHELGDAPEHTAHGGGPGLGPNGHGPGAARPGTAATHGQPAAAASAHGEAHGGKPSAHGDEHGDEHHDDPAADPPVHLGNPKQARPYEWMLTLLARPRYNEVDPTTLLLLFFPLFFGLMVGDVLVGLAIVFLGLWLRTHNLVGIGGPAVGRALVAGGIVSILVGAFVFGEALGIHFVVSDEALEEGEMSWENVLGLHIPYGDGLVHKTGSPGAGHGGAEDLGVTDSAVDAGPGTGLAPAATSGEEAHGIFTPHSDVHLAVGPVVLGHYSKIHDVQALLIWSLVIGLVHLVLGFILGIRNVNRAHGAALAIQEKAAWLTLMAGGVLAYYGSTMRDALGITATGYLVLGIGMGVVVASIALLWMGAAKVFGAGYVAILELPGLVSNMASYTRLAAIGISKAGLVVALSAICFGIIGGGVLGWILYFVGFIGIVLLAVLSAGLQSLRLQFVEFFGKFFTGGGRPYVPFGRRAA